MRKILFSIGLIISIGAMAQTPPGFTKVYQKYEWLGGKFNNVFGVVPQDTTTAPVFIGEMRIRTTGGDNTLYLGLSLSGKKWYKQGGGAGGGGSYVESIRLGSSLNVDTLFSTTNGTETAVGYIDREDGLISGGIVTWSGIGLVFDVTPAVYRINGVRYTSSAGSITLSAADPSNPRIDVIGVDNTGAIIKVTGDAASNPIEPQVDPSSQIYLTSVQVNAGATTPNGVSSTTVYDENIEWAITPQGVTVNANNTSNLYKGAKSLDVSSWSNLQQIAFTNGSALNPASYATLKLFVKLKASITGSSNITATFFNGSTAVTNEVNLTGYGLIRNNTSYQNISIPFTAFTFANSFDKLRIRFTGTGSGCYLDYITVQSGVVTQPTVQGLQNAYAVMTDGTNNATASGGDRFTFRTDNTLSKAVTNNDATYGDNILLKADTSVLSTRAWRQKGLDSLAANIKLRTQSKSITVESPTSSENIAMFYTDIAITVTKLAEALKGTSPSVTYQINHATARDSGSPNLLFSSGRTATTTSGTTTTTFNDPTIPAGSWVWITTSAASGTISGINITLIYTID